MTQEDIKSIEDISGTRGFRVLEASIKAKLEKLDSVREINPDALVAEQALGRKLASEVLVEFLEELNFTVSTKAVKNTYE